MINIKSIFHTNHTLKNISIVGFFSLSSKLVGLLTFGYGAKVLGPSNYGIVGFGSIILSYATIFIFPGITNWASRLIAQKSYRIDSVFFTVVTLRLILALLSFIAIFFFSMYYVTNSTERTIVLICSTALFTSATSIDWVYNGLHIMGVFSFFSFLGSILNLILLYGFVRTPSDIFFYASISTLNTMLVVVFSYIYLFKNYNIKIFIPKKKKLITILRLSFKLSIASTIIIVIHYFNSFLLKYYLGNYYLGLFLAAYTIFELMAYIPTILGSVLISKLAKIKFQNRENLTVNANIVSHLHMLLAFYFSAIIFCEAHEIIVFFFGNQYLKAVIILKILSFGIISNFAICGYTNYLVSFGEDDSYLRSLIVILITAILSGFFLTSNFGLIGASISIILIDLSGWLYSLRSYKKIIGSLNIDKWVLPIVGFLGIIFSNYLLKSSQSPLFVRIILSSLVYFLCVFYDLKYFYQFFIRTKII